MKAPPEQLQVIADKIAGQAESVPWLLIVFILFGAAIVSWAITGAIKKTAMSKWRYDHKGASAKEAKRSLWWTPLLILLSMLIGFGVGCAVGALEWKTLYGGLVGACGGALASFLVSLFKGHLTALAKKMAGGKATSGGNE